jgi:hypothetical protein
MRSLLIVLLPLAGCAGPVKDPAGDLDSTPRDSKLTFADGSPDGPAPAADLGADSVFPDGSAPDTTPAPKLLERTLSYTGSGSSSWLHVVRRNPGASDVSVRTARVNPNLNPQFAMDLATKIGPSQCKEIKFSGTTSDGTPYTTTVSSCLAGDNVTIFHEAVIGGTAGLPQTHGTLSMDPKKTSLPYERSLHFVGSGGGGWLHVARLPVGDTLVDVRTMNGHDQFDPGFHDNEVKDLAPQACKSTTLVGTDKKTGVKHTTKVDYCRSGSSVTIKHSSDGNPAQLHGSIPIE